MIISVRSREHNLDLRGYLVVSVGAQSITFSYYSTVSADQCHRCRMAVDEHVPVNTWP